MKKIICAFSSVIVVSLFLIGCSSAEKTAYGSAKTKSQTTQGSKAQVSAPETSKYKFAIYLVKGLSTGEALQKNIADLQLEKEPVLCETNIHAYYWRSNAITIKKNIIDERLMKTVNMTGSPFVAVANGERIYLGVFWSPFSSVSTPEDIPIIDIIPGVVPEELKQEGYEETLQSDETCLLILKPYKGDDKRNNKKIYEALKAAEILKK